MKTDWLILTATLPTRPSGLRVRVWRTLKATGAASLREGVYLLPEHAGSASTLRELEHTIREAGAEAHMLAMAARDVAQEQSFRAMFDRSEQHAAFLQSLKEARSRLATASAAELRRELRSLDAQLLALQAQDFFPGESGEQVAAAAAALRRELELRLSPDEPSARAGAIVALNPADYQARTWASRKRPWIDRLATAWLIGRFIDRRPVFRWLADASKCPKRALGYDFDGAAFTHVGDKVTFEVVAESFGLLARDPALARLGELVHFIDVGGFPVDEAAGLETLVRGLQALHVDDDALLAAALPVFDALHAAMGAADER